MLLTLLTGKIHRATVTEANRDYEGSISIDGRLLDAAGIRAHERVDVYDVTNGSRFATYAIRAEAGAGTIGINGAAAHLAHPGDLVIIAAYGLMTPGEAGSHVPRVVFVDERNRVREVRAAEGASTVSR